MQDHHSQDGLTPAERRHDATSVVLDLLVKAHPSLVTMDELGLMYGGSTLDRKIAHLRVQDGIAELIASGLAHQLEQFVFASRAAVRATELGEAR